MSFAAETCGVPEDLIVEAARKIGRAKSCCLQWGVAMDHTSEGFITGMACFDLMALTGNFEKPGRHARRRTPPIGHERSPGSPRELGVGRVLRAGPRSRDAP